MKALRDVAQRLRRQLWELDIVGSNPTVPIRLAVVAIDEASTSGTSAPAFQDCPGP